MAARSRCRPHRVGSRDKGGRRMDTPRSRPRLDRRPGAGAAGHGAWGEVEMVPAAEGLPPMTAVHRWLAQTGFRQTSTPTPLRYIHRRIGAADVIRGQRAAEGFPTGCRSVSPANSRNCGIPRRAALRRYRLMRETRLHAGAAGVRADRIGVIVFQQPDNPATHIVSLQWERSVLPMAGRRLTGSRGDRRPGTYVLSDRPRPPPRDQVRGV